MKQLRNTEMAAQPSRHFLLVWDFIIPVLILALGTIIFRSTNLDIAIQGKYYAPGKDWLFDHKALPMFIYTYGNIPALLLSLLGLLIFIFSYSKAKLLPYRKIGIYLVLVMAIGPGLIANALLKDNWGRPRPREIEQFGGDYAYEAPLTYDASSPGKSFPCGHATTGFYFFALAIVLRTLKPRLAFAALLFALLWGIIIGWIRIGMGGHFASDVVWAGGVVYLSAFAIYRIMGLDKQLLYHKSGTKPQAKLKILHKVLLWSLGCVILLGVLLATPYSAKREFKIGKELGSSPQQKLEFNMEYGVVSLDKDSSSVFTYQNDGFGFPGSKLKTRVEYQQNVFSFKQWKKGLFTEISCDASLAVDSVRVQNLSIQIDKGSVKLSEGFAGILYVSPRTQFDPREIKAVVIRCNIPPAEGWWLDVPSLIGD